MRALSIVCVVLLLELSSAALDREAFSFSKYDLQIRMEPATHAFAASGIDAIPLQGPVLAARAYGDIGLRTCRNLKLLTRESDMVLAADKLNPQIAARLVTPFGRWRRFEPKRAAMMRQQLERIAAAPGLSKDVFEQVSKSLA